LIFQFIQLKFISFHTCFVFDKSWKSIYLSKIFIRAKEIAGFNRSKWESFLLTYKIPYDASNHESKYYVELLKCNHQHDLSPQLFPLQSDFEFLNNSLLQVKNKIVAILAGGANNPGIGDEPFRRWPIEKYCDLAKKIIDHGYTILLVGGSSDISLNQEIENVCKPNCINFTNKISLVQSGIALSKASLIITNDSGLMHLASCFNNNLLCLLSTSSPVSILPNVKNAQFFWVDEDIYEKKGRIFGTFCIPNEKRALYLKRLSVFMVYEKVLQMLNGLSE
jgi:ADP-heptose:LPS heptosyltransferase